MDKTGKELLKLMFRPNETICVSHNKYGHHSLLLEEVLDKEIVTLIPTQASLEARNLEFKEENFEKVSTDKLIFVALNPIKGWRDDDSVTKYRNFLAEIDEGSPKDQLDYIKKIGIPYSAIIHSGNKSLHVLISLDFDLPTYEKYYETAEWILNIATMCDPLTKNPSRSIRIPGAYREPGKKQRLVELKGPTKIEDLAKWLNKYPEAKPKKKEKREPSGEMDFSQIRPWVSKKLIDGINENRNQTWYAIGYELALAGYNEDDAVEKLSRFFTPDRDFKEKEWKTAIKSAFKHVLKNQ